MEQNRNSELHPYIYGQLIFFLECAKTIQWIIILSNDAVIIGYTSTKKCEVSPIPQIIYKNQFIMAL